MKKSPFWLAAGLFLSFTTFSVKASLIHSTINGDNVVYSNIDNATWTADANLLGTLISTLGFNTVVDAIIAVSPTVSVPKIYDGGPCCILEDHTLVTSDFDVTGTANRFGSVAFTQYLSTISYAGSNEWRLPNDEDFGLLIDELGGDRQNLIPNTDNFINEKSIYMTTPGSAPILSWGYYPFRIHLSADSLNYVWAISPGNIAVPAAVPVPAALWLFASGVMGLIGLTRRTIIK